MSFTEQQTVAQIAAASLAAVRVFEAHGIDYCCGGKRPIGEVCQEQGIEPDKLLAELTQATTSATGEQKDWQTASLRDLVKHIVTTHHEYLKLELPRLNQRLNKVITVYGQQDAETLSPLPELFGGLWEELDTHMHKEELMLFPMIERYESFLAAGEPLPPVPFGSIANPIRVMEMEHDSAGDALKAMREITRGYQLPAHACSTYTALFKGFEELEADLHTHIHLENNILFPRAIELESANR